MILINVGSMLVTVSFGLLTCIIEWLVQFSAPSVGYGITTDLAHERPRGLRALRELRVTTLKTTARISCSVVSGRNLFSKVYSLWVFCFRESLASFERNSISSYFDRLLDATTVGVRDIVSLLQVLLGILLNFSAPFLRVMLLFECTFFTVFIRFLAYYTYQSDL
jgi:hypothetical protein